MNNPLHIGFVPKSSYTIAEAAALLSTPRTTLQDAIAREEIPSVGIGKRKIIPGYWINERLAPGMAPA